MNTTAPSLAGLRRTLAALALAMLAGTAFAVAESHQTQGSHVEALRCVGLGGSTGSGHDSPFDCNRP